MEYYSSHINKLIEQLSHLPGIGAKSAQRLAFHIMNMPKDQVEQLTASITDARQNVPVSYTHLDVYKRQKRSRQKS